MNSFMIKKLVAKDWYFNRYIMVAYLVGGFVAMAVMFSGGQSMYTVGSILLVTAIISLACHLVMGTVVQERKMQTLPFIMSLPVSVTDYTVAKLVANLSVYLLPWSLLSGFLITIMSSSIIGSGGAVPIFTLMLVWMFITYMIMLAAALISESEGWTVLAMVVCNTAFTFVFMGLNAIEGVGGELINQPDVVWTDAALLVLAGEVLLIAAILGLIFYCQRRKTDFL
ncbi:hypothetical protein [Kordiimonas aestuarii]|uniref:hypothetical protein n=1 Tax=Kordiimonas aestuarii TaxID=1005925 RepID=UPI0021CE31EC|nr:hypothetical protein [Kordiimonas aestuarii]